MESRKEADYARAISPAQQAQKYRDLPKNWADTKVFHNSNVILVFRLRRRRLRGRKGSFQKPHHLHRKTICRRVLPGPPQWPATTPP
jgi:hypothetical protein